MVRNLLIFFFTVLLAGCSFQSVSEPRRPDPENEPTPVPTAASVEKPTYLVERGDVNSQLTLSGRVMPVNQTDLTFASSGQIVEILIEQNDQVSAGDVVARLDQSGLIAELEAAKSRVAIAESQLNDALEQAELSRVEAEIARDQIQLQLDYAADKGGDAPSAEDQLTIDLLQLDLRLAQLRLDQLTDVIDPELEAQVAATRLNVEAIMAAIGETELIAPIAGQALSIHLSVGDEVEAGETLTILADLSSLEVGVRMASCDMRGLTEGLAASGVVANRPIDAALMTIRELPFPFGSGNPEDGEECLVRAAFDDPTFITNVQLGDRVQLVVELEKHEDVLWLPPSAVREFNGRNFVVVQNGSAQRRVDVTIGLQNNKQMEIEAGVEEGDVVIGP